MDRDTHAFGEQPSAVLQDPSAAEPSAIPQQSPENVHQSAAAFQQPPNAFQRAPAMNQWIAPLDSFHRSIVAAMEKLLNPPAVPFTVQNTNHQPVHIADPDVMAVPGPVFRVGDSIYSIPASQANPLPAPMPISPNFVRGKDVSVQQRARRIDRDVNLPILESAIPAQYYEAYVVDGTGKTPKRLMEAARAYIEYLLRLNNTPAPRVVPYVRTPSGRPFRNADPARIAEGVAYWALEAVVPGRNQAKVDIGDGELVGRLCIAAADYIYELEDAVLGDPELGRTLIF